MRMRLPALLIVVAKGSREFCSLKYEQYILNGLVHLGICISSGKILPTDQNDILALNSKIFSRLQSSLQESSLVTFFGEAGVFQPKAEDCRCDCVLPTLSVQWIPSLTCTQWASWSRRPRRVQSSSSASCTASCPSWTWTPLSLKSSGHDGGFKTDRCMRKQFL